MAKNSRVFHRVKGNWYCMEYPTFDELVKHDPRAAVERAEAMIKIHSMSERVFYIGPTVNKNGYIYLKCDDGKFESPEPNLLKSMKGYLPEVLLDNLKGSKHAN